jgi:glycosyltransferase involved in cell wall biosynthesis
VTTVHVLVPAGLEDRPSGGNTYDRRICAGLAVAGWDVRQHQVAGGWPEPAAGVRLDRLVSQLPDGALVLVDGLVAAGAGPALTPHAERLRLVVLVHMLHPGERDVLTAAAAVLATSCWTRDQLLTRYPLRPELVRVARPGVDPAEPAAASDDGHRLLCVAALAPHKGHDLLVGALSAVADRPWQCACVGPLDRDPGFVEALRHQIEAAGLGSRIGLVGPLTGSALDEAYRAADLLVLASRSEAYGMVVTEALARGVPVLTTAVGGLPEALGGDADGNRPGLLVPPEDPAALAGALRRWLAEAELRARLRAAAWERRRALTGWDVTVGTVAAVLAEAAR